MSKVICNGKEDHWGCDVCPHGKAHIKDDKVICTKGKCAIQGYNVECTPQVGRKEDNDG